MKGQKILKGNFDVFTSQFLFLKRGKGLHIEHNGLPLFFSFSHVLEARAQMRELFLLIF